MSKLILDAEKELPWLRTMKAYYSGEATQALNELMHIIKTITATFLNSLADNVTLEQERITTSLSSLRQMHDHFISKSREINQNLRIEHDPTFLCLQTSAQKEEINLSDIPKELKAKDLHQFTSEEFVSRIVEMIHTKFKIRFEYYSIIK